MRLLRTVTIWISVDGDTSTNDTLAIMASGKAGNRMITNKNEDYYTFLSGLTAAFRALAKKLAGDGEGATKLLVCKVEGAKSKPNAVKVAKRHYRFKPCKSRNVRFGR